MPGIEKRTVSLPAARASYIGALVEAGTYASASEVVRTGLRALRQHDSAVARWLHEKEAPAYDSMQAAPRPLRRAGHGGARRAPRRAAEEGRR